MSHLQVGKESSESYGVANLMLLKDYTQQFKPTAILSGLLNVCR